jgi:hypothetical protein
MRRPEGFNLAFLDIMACGLGAVVLILVLLKNQEGASAQVEQTPAVDVAALEQQISELTAEVDQLQQKIDSQTNQSSQEADKTAAIIAQLQIIKSQAQAKAQELKKLQQALTVANKGLNSKLAELQNSNIEIKQQRAQEFLIGLEVKGERIAILVDSSSSMLAETLIDITLFKAKGASDRQNAAKWKRTKASAKWLLANVPQGSEFRLFQFSDQVKEVTNGWSKANTPQALVNAQNLIEKIDPAGGTNVEDAVSTVLKLNPSSIYVITDGLPTIGKRAQSIVPSGGCGGITGKSRVSGECRASLFTDVESLSSSYGGTISVILLPLEGDPAAAPLYTRWTLAHRGTLLSPAKGWP